MAQEKEFYCMRCEARFLLQVIPRVTLERTCPKCGSNSVRQETAASLERYKAKTH
jgi:Zn finger protein HypA/HybF involved in hydrogenase expression